MALIKYGGGIVQMSGSIAGNTYARNRYGNYARARTKPTNPNTGLQQAVRTAVAQLTMRWSQTVTAVQRAAWNLYADNVAMTNKLGETMHLSGFNHYVRSNAFLQAYNKTIVDAGPVIFELPEADSLFSITATEGPPAINVTFDDTLDWDNETGGYLIYYQGAPQNPQRNFFDGPWRLLSYTAGVTGAPVASPVVESPVFGLSQGQRQWVYARILRADGRLSQPFRADTFCAA